MDRDNRHLHTTPSTGRSGTRRLEVTFISQRYGTNWKFGPSGLYKVQKFSKHNDSYMIYGVLITGTISIILTAFFHDRTAYLYGSEHSVALYVTTVFTALKACTSSVLFMPYMGRFKEKYLVTYFIGEGLSGLLPSVVALVQGVGGAPECHLVNVTESGEQTYEKYLHPPLFGTREFFFFLSTMTVLSMIAFLLLDRLQLCRKHYAAVRVGYGNDYFYEREMNDTDNGQINSNTVIGTDTINNDLSQEIAARTYTFLLLLMGIVNFFASGMFTSIQSFSCLPYGGQAYHLSATLSLIANPFSCFLAFFLPHNSLRDILTLSALASALMVYIFVTAVLSPFPPLYNTSIGGVLVVMSWTVMVGLVSCVKLSITSVMRSQGGKSLVWTGGVSQLGSTLGSILIFVLINYTKSFTAANEEC